MRNEESTDSVAATIRLYEERVRPVRPLFSDEGDAPGWIVARLWPDLWAEVEASMLAEEEAHRQREAGDPDAVERMRNETRRIERAHREAVRRVAAGREQHRVRFERWLERIAPRLTEKERIA